MAFQANQDPFLVNLQHQLQIAQQQIQNLTSQISQANDEIARLKAQGPQMILNHPRPPFVAPPTGSLPPPPHKPSMYTFVPNPIGQGMYNLIPNNQVQPNLTTITPTMQNHFQPANGEVTSSAQQEVNNARPNDPMAQRLKMLEEQNEKVLSLLSKLPGAAVPIDVEPKTGYQASPYIDEIALVDVPKKYNIPTFTPKYSGITDPVEHVAQYKQLMWTVSIPSQYQEVCMCKSFGSTLTGAALQWLINLKPKTIGSFAELVNQFTRQFASSRKMEKQTGDLYYIVQKTGESIRSYFNRFNAEMINVRNCDVKTAIEAYKRGLDDTSGLYVDLTKYPPENFDDVRARTLAYMRIEDDAARTTKQSTRR